MKTEIMLVIAILLLVVRCVDDNRTGGSIKNKCWLVGTIQTKDSAIQLDDDAKIIEVFTKIPKEQQRIVYDCICDEAVCLIENDLQFMKRTDILYKNKEMFDDWFKRVITGDIK